MTPEKKYIRVREQVKDSLTIIMLEADMILENEDLSERARQGIKRIKEYSYKISEAMDRI